MYQKRTPYSIAVGLAAMLLTILVLNLLTPGDSVVMAQGEPIFQLDIAAELAPDGDLNDNSQIDPGDTVEFTVQVQANEALSDPFEMILKYDAAFVSRVDNISDDGAVVGEDQIVWPLAQIEAGEAGALILSFDATLNDLVRPGLHQVVVSVVARLDEADIARDELVLEVTGPNLQIDIQHDLSGDVDGDKRVDPGDTVRFTISYSNLGGGRSEEVSIIADYPDSLTRAVLEAGDAQDAGGMLAWSIGSVPATGVTNTIQFNVVLEDKFPPGVTVYDLPVAIRDATETLAERVISVPVAISNIIITPRVEFLADADSDGLADEGDRVQVTIHYQNSGSGPAANVAFTSIYDPAQLEIFDMRPETDISEPGIIEWTLAALDVDESGTVSFDAHVLSLPLGLENIMVKVAVDSDDTAPDSQDLLIKADPPLPTPTPAPTLTPAPTPTPLPPPVLVAPIPIEPVQGEGALTSEAGDPTAAIPLSILIGGFLTLMLATITFIGWRALTPDLPQARRHPLVRELIEGVVMTAILFTVVLLGLQNAMDKESINSIIGGIVGYVAGRISSTFMMQQGPEEPPKSAPAEPEATEPEPAEPEPTEPESDEEE